MGTPTVLDTYGEPRTAFSARVDLGARNGPTVAVKDCIDIAGMVTRCGSAGRLDSLPAHAHAVVVDRLLAAGCRILGKTRMHELAYGMSGINLFEGTPLNPRWPELIPGGSSSGSAAAVAAGLVDFSIGTDTGGSVRQPAMCCGIFGLKPTFGRIDRAGIWPENSSLDCVGVMARNMRMIERAMMAIDPGFAQETHGRAPRLARICCGSDVDPQMIETFSALSAGAGDAISECELPLLDDAFRAGLTIMARETFSANAHMLKPGVRLGQDVRARLESARSVSDSDMEQAEDVRGKFSSEVDALLGHFDAILTPALPIRPPLLTEADDPGGVLALTRFLRPFNLSGHPAIVLPSVTSRGMPSGVQLVARKGEDAQLCAIARWLQEANPIFQTEE